MDTDTIANPGGDGDGSGEPSACAACEGSGASFRCAGVCGRSFHDACTGVSTAENGPTISVSCGSVLGLSGLSGRSGRSGLTMASSFVHFQSRVAHV